MKAKKGNPWMDHLNKCRKMDKYKGKTLSEVMKAAKKTYSPKKSK